MTTVSELNKTITAPIAPGRPMLAIVPFYHIFGMHPSFPLIQCLKLTATGVGNTLIGIFSYGCCIVIQARFDPIEFCANIEKYRISFSYLVPPMLVVLARHPGTPPMCRKNPDQLEMVLNTFQASSRS